MYIETFIYIYNYNPSRLQQLDPCQTGNPDVVEEALDSAENVGVVTPLGLGDLI